MKKLLFVLALTMAGWGTAYGAEPTAPTKPTTAAPTTQPPSAPVPPPPSVEAQSPEQQANEAQDMPPGPPDEEQLSEGAPSVPPAVPNSAPAEVASPPPTNTPPGQWVYTQQYGWLWMPHGQSYTYVPEQGDPSMYVYYPSYGWRWVVAPWVFGFGPRPYWGTWGTAHFAWYAHPWFRAGYHGGPHVVRPIGRPYWHGGYYGYHGYHGTYRGGYHGSYAPSHRTYRGGSHGSHRGHR